MKSYVELIEELERQRDGGACTKVDGAIVRELVNRMGADRIRGVRHKGRDYRISHTDQGPDGIIMVGSLPEAGELDDQREGAHRAFIEIIDRPGDEDITARLHIRPPLREDEESLAVEFAQCLIAMAREKIREEQGEIENDLTLREGDDV